MRVITDNEAKEMKELCLQELRTARKRYSERLVKIDWRLCEYISDCVRDDIDAANLYELLAIRKFLRMLDTYPFNIEKVHQVINAYEALKFDGLDGRQCYRLTPTQVMQLAAPFGFMKDETDMRRVCREANYFIPRKSSKTTLGAFFNFWFFFFEDFNAEVYCCANSQEQSKRLFGYTYDLIHQLDPEEKRIRFTQTVIDWREGQQKKCSITALSAGGKTKDGLFAQLCNADEFGSASYVGEKSDMANLVNVVRGSMGPRREPMTVITTTAGRVEKGPYRDKLEGILDSLREEMAVPLDGKPHKLMNDWQYAMVCQPDQWECDEHHLQQPYMWRKVNRHIGVTVQPDFYANEWAEMLKDEEKKKEQICKLFNVWQSQKTKQWLTGDEIRRLQIDKSVDDLKNEEDWVAFVGMDFSKGDDLCGVAYLCKNLTTGEFFGDMDAWVSEAALEKSANAPLYAKLVKTGHLRVSPGKTVDENLVLERLIEVADCVQLLRIGYDSYDAKRFVNSIATWMHTEFGVDPKDYLAPVAQTYGNYNSAVQEMTYMVQTDPAMIRFSRNELWPWEFGNAMLEEDRYENVKPVKSGPNQKVDNVQCLLSGLILHDQMQGQFE